MAFNPFNWFRKHQKVIFAGLTILCMFVFILSFGRGDFFEQMLGWMGARTAGGPKVVTLGGKALNEGDLSQLQRRRKMANDFLLFSVSGGQQKALEELLKGDLKDEAAQALPGTLAYAANSVKQIASSLQILRFFPPEQQQQQLDDIRFRLRQGFRTVSDEAARAKDDPERLRVVGRVGSLLGFVAWQLGQTSPNELLMGGDTGIDSLLDFVVWRQQADKMGISLTDADVMGEINSEAAGHAVFDPKVKPFDREPSVIGFVARLNDPRIKASDLMDALRDEFRVALARELATGKPSGTRVWRLGTEGASASPAVGTPDEFLAFYREMTTALKVRLLRVPVESFLKDAESAPSESELRSLYALYREREATPFSREPGFKESRRVKPEFVLGSAADPYYVALGRAAVRGTRVAGKPPTAGLADAFEDWRRARDVVLMPAMPVIGAGPGGALAIACGIGADLIQIEHSRHLDNSHAWAHEDAPRSDADGRLDLAAAFDAKTFAAVFPFANGNPLGATNTLYMTATYRDARASLLANLATLMGSGTTDGTLGYLALVANARPRPVSRAVVEPQILAALEERYALEALDLRMAEFSKKLRDYAGKSAPAAGTLEKLAKESHLVYGTTPKAVTQAVLSDQLRLKNDMGLGALRKKFEELARSVPPSALAAPFFNMAATFTPIPVFNDPSRKDRGLLWLGESYPPKILEFDEARPEVEAAFKLDAARQLARKAALALVAKINAKNATPRDANALLAEEKARDPRLGATFDLDNVALQTPQAQNLPERPTSYRPYDLPTDAQAEMSYPPGDLVKQLLELKRAGESRVVVDRPARNFYVAVLEARSPQTFDEFRKVYGRTPDKDTLYDAFLAQKQEDFYRAAVEQLRREAAGGKLDKNGLIEVSAEVRKRFSGSNVSED